MGKEEMAEESCLAVALSFWHGELSLAAHIALMRAEHSQAHGMHQR
jgi:hypothetical protein